MREYNLQYAREQNEASLTLEVVDDSIAENEETFIIYTSVIENPGDDCARAVRLRDNDGKNYVAYVCLAYSLVLGSLMAFQCATVKAGNGCLALFPGSLRLQH